MEVGEALTFRACMIGGTWIWLAWCLPWPLIHFIICGLHVYVHIRVNFSFIQLFICRDVFLLILRDENEKITFLFLPTKT